MRAKRPGINSLIGAIFFIIIVLLASASLALFFSTFNGGVSQAHQNDFNGVQEAETSAMVQNMTFGGEYFHNSTVITGAANSAQRPILPVSNMNFSQGMGGWTMSRQYAFLQDNASVLNTFVSSLVPGQGTFDLSVTNTNPGVGPRVLYGIARVTLLVDSNFNLGAIIQSAPASWTVSTTGNNITWTTPALNALGPGLKQDFQWTAGVPGEAGTFYHTVIISWVYDAKVGYVDEGIGTVNTAISATFPSPAPPASTASLTSAPANTLPGGALGGYDSNALTTTSQSGPGSLYVNFQPTFDSLPLPSGQQLNATIAFATSFNLDAQTTAAIAPTSCCAFSFEYSLDDIQSVQNPVIFFHVYLENNVTGALLSIPIGGRNPTAINYTDPTLVNYFGPTGWVYEHVSFYPKPTFWTAKGAGYHLILKVSMAMPGASPGETYYPSEVSMHFDDIGLALKLASPPSFYGSSAFEFRTSTDFHRVQGIELGFNLSNVGTTADLPKTVYAYVADNSLFPYNPPLWVEVGSVTFNNSGFIHFVAGLPNAAYYLNSTQPQLGNLDVRLVAISAYADFSLQVSAYAVVQTGDQYHVVVSILNTSDEPQHFMTLYTSGPNLATSFPLDIWVKGGQRVVVPEQFQWIQYQEYLVSVSTSTGLTFSRSFTAPAPNLGVTCADFKGLVLNHANFNGQDLFCADFTGAILNGATFVGADLRNAKFDGARFNTADFTDADLQGVSMQNGVFNNAVFTGANLAGANLQGSTLNGVSFASANLAGANLSGVTGNGLSAPDADLAGANLSNSHFANSDFSGDNLQNVDFSNSDLSNSNFTNADATGANFSGADISGIITTGCTGCP